jgi:hypothetical protein
MRREKRKEFNCFDTWKKCERKDTVLSQNISKFISRQRRHLSHPPRYRQFDSLTTERIIYSISLHPLHPDWNGPVPDFNGVGLD